MKPAFPVREPSVSEVKRELQDLLNSREFRQSKSLSKLLRYICITALIGESEQITEYTVGVDVHGKPKEFKECKDASVPAASSRPDKRR